MTISLQEMTQKRYLKTRLDEYERRSNLRIGIDLFKRSINLRTNLMNLLEVIIWHLYFRNLSEFPEFKD